MIDLVNKIVGEWIPEVLWRKVIEAIPIACVDVLVENGRGDVLLGWRRIRPYKDVWALPGGRLMKGEKLKAAATRILDEYGLIVGDMFLVGVFPVKFPSRADVSICIAGVYCNGDPKPDGKEFSSFSWTKKVPKGIGANYRRMIGRWRAMKKKPDVTKFDRL